MLITAGGPPQNYDSFRASSLRRFGRKWRHLIENFFCCLKAFRRIATRYEKTYACFAGRLNTVAAFLANR
jgi:transposase